MHTSLAEDKARVLFVDDERRVLNSMRGMFRRDFNLYLTTEGAKAVKIATENPIDVIVADQRMPGMSGVEVLGKVREVSPDTMRILLTGYADPSAVQGSINIGEVFRFLGKPCPPKLLRETLHLAINATRAAKLAKATQVASPAATSTTPPTSVDTPRPPETATPAPADNQQLLSRLNSLGDVSYSLERYRKRRDSAATMPTSSLTPEPRARIVLYTVDAQFAETSLRTLSSAHSVTLATSLIKVMQAIESNRCQVLVTDISTNSARLHKIISTLKQVRPELVSVVVSDTRDTTEMMRLINYGQIFRFVQKPVAAALLEEAVLAAAQKNQKLRHEPGALYHHQVAAAGAMDGMERATREHAHL